MQQKQQIRAFIASHSDDLKAALRLYASRAGLPPEQSAELLSEVTVEALEHADRFDSFRHPMSWLLGIGANLIKQRIDKLRRLNLREPLARDLYPDDDGLSDGELFDRIAGAADSSPDDLLQALLSQLSPDDRLIVQLAIVDGLDGDTLAKQLHINPGAARMRLHRALRRLRTLYMETER